MRAEEGYLRWRRNRNKWSNKTYHLLRGHTDCLNAEFTSTHVEEVFQIRPQQIYHQHVMQAFLTEVVDLGNAGCMNVRCVRRGSRSDKTRTYVCRSTSCMNETRLSAEVRRICEVPREMRVRNMQVARSWIKNVRI